MDTGVSAANQVQTSVLLVSHDGALAQSLAKLLAQYRYELCVHPDGASAVSSMQQAVPSIILVDGNGPTLAQLRARLATRRVPIMVMFPAGTDCDSECIPALDSGIDQILCKPVGPRQIVAHLRAMIRREQLKAVPQRQFTAADLSLDVDQHEVLLSGRVIPLTVKEFKILHELIRQPNRVFTRDELLNLVWGEEVALGEHNLDVHIHSLRRKIERDPTRPALIVTVRGVGYKLKTE